MRPAIRGVLAHVPRRHTPENADFRAVNPVSLSCEIFGVARPGCTLCYASLKYRIYADCERKCKMLVNDKVYRYFNFQDEWRIVFEGARSDGSLLGDLIDINPQTPLGKFLASRRKEIEEKSLTSYEDFLSGFREIKLNLENLKTIARIID